MKIISFYSYKGGVGRTYLTAQVARCLAALGKKVVILDFDMDAPGILGSFELKKEKDIDTITQLGYYTKAIGGFYELSNDYLNLDIREQSSLNKNNVEDFQKDLNTYLIEVDIGKLTGEQLKSDSNKSNNSGYIKIIPSGRLSALYWTDVSSVEWLKLVDAEASENSLRGFLEKALSPALENMGVEYLLIDSRAGVTHYGGIARHVAKCQVMVLVPNAETEAVLGEYLLPELHRRHAKDLEKMVFAIGRIPYEFIEKERNAVDRAEKFLDENITSKVQKCSVKITIASDLETYYDLQARTFDERYIFSKSENVEISEYYKRVEIVKLHEDILSLVAALCPETLPYQSDNMELKDQAHILWEAIYGSPFKITKRNRMFVQKNDLMLNIDDGERNVAFKVETFLNLLRGIRETLSDKDELKKALYVAGKQCGKNFGNAIHTDWVENGKENELGRPIEAWCEFDTRTGFGQMDYENGIIIVKDAFILDSTATDNKGDFTHFFDGYVEGVLEELGYKLDGGLLEHSNGNLLKYRVTVED